MTNSPDNQFLGKSLKDLEDLLSRPEIAKHFPNANIDTVLHALFTCAGFGPHPARIKYIHFSNLAFKDPATPLEVKHEVYNGLIRVGFINIIVEQVPENLKQIPFEEINFALHGIPVSMHIATTMQLRNILDQG